MRSRRWRTSKVEAEEDEMLSCLNEEEMLIWLINEGEVEKEGNVVAWRREIREKMLIWLTEDRE